MAIAWVATALVVGSASGATTVGIDTTGANFIILGTTFANSPTISDNKGNTANYVGLTPTTNGKIYYCPSPVVGSGHTFTISGASTFSSICALAFSGVSAFDQQSHSATTQPGSITPPSDGALLVSLGMASGTNDPSAIDSGFTLATHAAGVNSVKFGTGLAYLIQTTAAAVNPTWTGASQSAMASFTAAAGGGGTTTSLFRQSLLNGLGSGGPFFNNPLGRSMIGWVPKLVIA